MASPESISLQAETDLTKLAGVVGTFVWGDSDASGIEVKDTSGLGGGKVYFVTKTGATPEKVVLKIKSLQSSSSISADRMEAATAAMQKAGLFPKPLHKGADWTVDPYLGSGVAKDRFHWDEALAPPAQLAVLMAKIHAIPTDWYEPHRAKVVARDPRLTELLQSSPPHSHVWCPFGWGLENGMVFLGGGFPNPDVAKEVMERQIKSGIYEKFMRVEAFWPVSEAGRRIVTVHGDYKTDNVLRNDKGELVSIDFEFMCAGAAVNELSIGLICYSGEWWGAYTYEKRLAFVTTYLKAAGLPAGQLEARALMLDAEINTLGSFAGVMSNFYDAHIPLLRGSPHPTAATKELPFVPGDSGSAGCNTSDAPSASEAIDALAAAVEEVRASPELVEAVLCSGMVPTLHARKAGKAALWTFLDDLQGRNMLRLFGIAPAE